MDVAVRHLDRREITAASRLLGEAFAADPFIGYFLTDARRRRLAFPSFFRAVLHELVPVGGVYASEVDGALAGVAAWLPPSAPQPSSWARLRARASTVCFRTLFPRASVPLLAGFEELGAHHPLEPHWYLAFVGVEAGLQGRGVGRTLLAPVLRHADADGTVCYLETPFPRTHAFYRRLGFEIAAELNPVPGAPPVWSMVRAPLQQGAE